MRVPDYNSALNQLKSGTAAGLGRPRRDRREDRQGQRRQGHPGGQAAQLGADGLRRRPRQHGVPHGAQHRPGPGDQGRHLDQAAGAVLPGPPGAEGLHARQWHGRRSAGQGRRRRADRAMDILQTLRETFLDLGRHARGAARAGHGRPAQHPAPGAVLGRAGHAGGDGAGRLRAVPVALAALAGPRLHRRLPWPARGRDDPAHRRRSGAGRPGDLGAQPLSARHPRPLADRLRLHRRDLPLRHPERGVRAARGGPRAGLLAVHRRCAWS